MIAIRYHKDTLFHIVPVWGVWIEIQARTLLAKLRYFKRKKLHIKFTIRLQYDESCVVGFASKLMQVAFYIMR